MDKSTIVKLPDKRRLVNTILDSNLSAIFLLGASSEILVKVNKICVIRHHTLTTRNRIIDGPRSTLFLLKFAILLEESIVYAKSLRSSGSKDNKSKLVISSIAKQALDAVKAARVKGQAIRTVEIESMKVLATMKPPKKCSQGGVIFCMDHLEPGPCPRCNNLTLVALEGPNEVTKKRSYQEEEEEEEACSRSVQFFTVVLVNNLL